MKIQIKKACKKMKIEQFTSLFGVYVDDLFEIQSSLLLLFVAGAASESERDERPVYSYLER